MLPLALLCAACALAGGTFPGVFYMIVLLAYIFTVSNYAAKILAMQFNTSSASFKWVPLAGMLVSMAATLAQIVSLSASCGSSKSNICQVLNSPLSRDLGADFRWNFIAGDCCALLGCIAVLLESRFLRGGNFARDLVAQSSSVDSSESLDYISISAPVPSQTRSAASYYAGHDAAVSDSEHASGKDSDSDSDSDGNRRHHAGSSVNSDLQEESFDGQNRQDEHEEVRRRRRRDSTESMIDGQKGFGAAAAASVGAGGEEDALSPRSLRAIFSSFSVDVASHTDMSSFYLLALSLLSTRVAWFRVVNYFFTEKNLPVLRTEKSADRFSCDIADVSISSDSLTVSPAPEQFIDLYSAELDTEDSNRRDAASLSLRMTRNNQSSQLASAERKGVVPGWTNEGARAPPAVPRIQAMLVALSIGLLAVGALLPSSFSSLVLWLFGAVPLLVLPIKRRLPVQRWFTAGVSFTLFFFPFANAVGGVSVVTAAFPNVFWHVLEAGFPLRTFSIACCVLPPWSAFELVAAWLCLPAILLLACTTASISLDAIVIRAVDIENSRASRYKEPAIARISHEMESPLLSQPRSSFVESTSRSPELEFTSDAGVYFGPETMMRIAGLALTFDALMDVDALAFGTLIMGLCFAAGAELCGNGLDTPRNAWAMSLLDFAAHWQVANIAAILLFNVFVTSAFDISSNQSTANVGGFVDYRSAPHALALRLCLKSFAVLVVFWSRWSVRSATISLVVSHDWRFKVLQFLRRWKIDIAEHFLSLAAIIFASLASRASALNSVTVALGAMGTVMRRSQAEKSYLWSIIALYSSLVLALQYSFQWIASKSSSGLIWNVVPPAWIGLCCEQARSRNSVNPMDTMESPWALWFISAPLWELVVWIIVVVHLAFRSLVTKKRVQEHVALAAALQAVTASVGGGITPTTVAARWLLRAAYFLCVCIVIAVAFADNSSLLSVLWMLFAFLLLDILIPQISSRRRRRAASVASMAVWFLLTATAAGLVVLRYIYQVTGVHNAVGGPDTIAWQFSFGPFALKITFEDLGFLLQQHASTGELFRYLVGNLAVLIAALVQWRLSGDLYRAASRDQSFSFDSPSIMEERQALLADDEDDLSDSEVDIESAADPDVHVHQVIRGILWFGHGVLRAGAIHVNKVVVLALWIACLWRVSLIGFGYALLALVGMYWLLASPNPGPTLLPAVPLWKQRLVNWCVLIYAQIVLLIEVAAAVLPLAITTANADFAVFSWVGISIRDARIQQEPGQVLFLDIWCEILVIVTSFGFATRLHWPTALSCVNVIAPRASQLESNDQFDVRMVINEFFSIFGYPIFLTVLALSLALRTSILGLVYAGLLGTCLACDRRTITSTWFLGTVLGIFSTVALIQYAIALGLPPTTLGQPQLWPWHTPDFENQYISVEWQKWLILRRDSVAGLSVDFVLMFFTALLLAVTRIGKMPPVQASGAPRQLQSLGCLSDPRLFIDAVDSERKTAYHFMRHSPSMILVLILVLGTAVSDLLSFGYFVLALVYLYNVDSWLVTAPLSERTRRWRYLRWYNFVLIVAQLAFQCPLFRSSLNADPASWAAQWPSIVGLKAIDFTVASFFDPRRGITLDLLICILLSVELTILQRPDFDRVRRLLETDHKEAQKTAIQRARAEKSVEDDARNKHIQMLADAESRLQRWQRQRIRRQEYVAASRDSIFVGPSKAMQPSYTLQRARDLPPSIEEASLPVEAQGSDGVSELPSDTEQSWSDKFVLWRASIVRWIDRALDYLDADSKVGRHAEKHDLSHGPRTVGAHMEKHAASHNEVPAGKWQRIKRVLDQRTELFVAIACFVAHAAHGSLLTIVFPLAILGYVVLVRSPAPYAKFWNVLLAYTVFVLCAKFVVQIPVFCICNGPTGSSLSIFPHCAGISTTERCNFDVQEEMLELPWVLGLVPAAFASHSGSPSSSYGSSSFLQDAFWDFVVLSLILWHRVATSRRGVRKDLVRLTSVTMTGQSRNSALIPRSKNVSWTRSFKTYWQELFTAVKPTPARDFTNGISTIEGACFLLLVFFQEDFSGIPSNQVRSIFDSNKIPAVWLGILLAQFALIIVQRIIFLLGSMKAHVILHYLLTVFYHVMLFFVLPFVNRKPFVHSPSLIAFYLLKCFSLVLSGEQAAHGFSAPHEKRIGSWFTRGDPSSSLRELLVNVYRALPFVFELNALLQFSLTATALSFRDFLKLDSFYYDLYLVQCRWAIEQAGDRPFGHKQPRSVKCTQGVLVFAVLVVLLWFPLLILSSANPANVANIVVASKASIGIRGWQPLWSMNQLETTAVIDKASCDRLRLAYPSELRADECDDTQVLTLPPPSEVLWQPTPPAFHDLLTYLTAGDIGVPSAAIAIHLQFERTRSPNQPSISGTWVRRLSTVERALVAHSIVNATSQSGNTDIAVEIPSALPRVVAVPAQGSVQFSSTGPTISLRLTISKRDYNLTQSARAALRIFGDDPAPTKQPSLMWWTVEQIPESKNPPFDSTTISLISISGTVQQGITASLAVSGIIGLYVTVVFAVGRFLRLWSAELIQRVWLDDMPDPTMLQQMCDDIYLWRIHGRFYEEEEVWVELRELLRSPSDLAERTKAKQE